MDFRSCMFFVVAIILLSRLALIVRITNGGLNVKSFFTYHSFDNFFHHFLGSSPQIIDRQKHFSNWGWQLQSGSLWLQNKLFKI